ncbi:hypothetical protein HYFRA_00011450 [Hymenoscyphus fraxineus]|uniref:Uncharacterized protein n=1 Tax=Hymenoscyphus fraxineus TaxID=746836 RepID=A0A9N9PKS3_9HELO|nr:hypothetical protein HYFRA_00011450 [Hymenoscyphus fraxineus]
MARASLRSTHSLDSTPSTPAIRDLEESVEQNGVADSQQFSYCTGTFLSAKQKAESSSSRRMRNRRFATNHQPELLSTSIVKTTAFESKYQASLNRQRRELHTLQIVLAGLRANLICAVKGVYIPRQANEHQESLPSQPAGENLPHALSE